MTAVRLLVFAGIGLVAAALLLPLLADWLRKPSTYAGSSAIADALGNFIDVFDPGNARAARDLKQHENAGPVTPSPDDDDAPVRLIRGPDGRPRAVRVRPPRPPA